MKIIEEIIGTVDKLVPDMDKKNELKTELSRIVQTSVTDRHQQDMASHSWLSNNIRPLSLLFFMALFAIGCFTNLINEFWGKIIESCLMLFMSFYFGARTLEKGGGIGNLFNRKN